jgi:hypothetical protein
LLLLEKPLQRSVEFFFSLRNSLKTPSLNPQIYRQYALDAENIRLYKGIPEGGEILDYMGREELASNLFRITQTEGRLRREQIVGEDAAIQAHFAVGREVRDTLKRLGATMPEDLPTADSIRVELERQRRARQKILRNKKHPEGQEPLLS